MSIGEKEMEPIKEEDTPPNSANSVKCEQVNRLPSPLQTKSIPSKDSCEGTNSSQVSELSHQGNTAEGALGKSPSDNETNQKSNEPSPLSLKDELDSAVSASTEKKELKESAVWDGSYMYFKCNWNLLMSPTYTLDLQRLICSPKT